MKIHNLVRGQLVKKKHVTWLSSKLKERYNHMILVGGYLYLTAVNRSRISNIDAVAQVLCDSAVCMRLQAANDDEHEKMNRWVL